MALHIVGPVLFLVLFLLALVVISYSYWAGVLILVLLLLVMVAIARYLQIQSRQEERKNFGVRVERKRGEFDSLKDIYPQAKMSYNGLKQQYPMVFPETLDARFREINISTLGLELDLLVADSGERGKRKIAQVEEEFEALFARIGDANGACREIVELFKRAGQAKTESESLLELLPDQIDSVRRAFAGRDVADAIKIEFDVAQRQFTDAAAEKDKDPADVNWIELQDTLRRIQTAIAKAKQRTNSKS